MIEHSTGETPHGESDEAFLKLPLSDLKKKRELFRRRDLSDQRVEALRDRIVTLLEEFGKSLEEGIRPSYFQQVDDALRDHVLGKPELLQRILADLRRMGGVEERKVHRVEQLLVEIQQYKGDATIVEGLLDKKQKEQGDAFWKFDEDDEPLPPGTSKTLTDDEVQSLFNAMRDDEGGTKE